MGILFYEFRTDVCSSTDDNRLRYAFRITVLHYSPFRILFYHLVGSIYHSTFLVVGFIIQPSSWKRFTTLRERFDSPTFFVEGFIIFTVQFNMVYHSTPKRWYFRPFFRNCIIWVLSVDESITSFGRFIIDCKKVISYKFWYEKFVIALYRSILDVFIKKNVLVYMLECLLYGFLDEI